MECFNTFCRDTKSDKFLCSRCKKSYYCSKECQHAHYKIHKKICGKNPIPDIGIRQTNDKNEGIFALEDIQRNQVILEEPALIEIRFPAYETIHQHYKDLYTKYHELSPDKRLLYDRLWNAHINDESFLHTSTPSNTSIGESGGLRILKEKDRLMGAFLSNYFLSFSTNAFVERRKIARVHGFLSKFNHSCDPNAAYLWDEGRNIAVIIALKNIKQDEEIYISYGPWNRAGREYRQSESLRIFKFKCACRLCTYTTSTSESRFGSGSNSEIVESSLEIMKKFNDKKDKTLADIDEILNLPITLDDLYLGHLFKLKMQIMIDQDDKLLKNPEYLKALRNHDICTSIFSSYSSKDFVDSSN